MVLCTNCHQKPALSQGETTSAGVEVLHPGVTVEGRAVTRRARVSAEGRVETAADGRGLVRTDDGLELRMAGGSVVVFHEGAARVERGRVFVTGWGDADRVVYAGAGTRLQVRDAALEVERGSHDRVIVVRGEVAWQRGGHQGQLAQGEALAADGDTAVHPADVWDDWTGGAASPQGLSQREPTGLARAVSWTSTVEAPSPLAMSEVATHVTVTGDLAVTVSEQAFFNGSEQTSPVEYRLRLPPEAIVGRFEVRYGEGAWNEWRPIVVAGDNRGGGAWALRRSEDGDLVGTLGNLATGQTVRARITYTTWLAHDGARRTLEIPLGDPVAPQRVGEYALDVDLTGASTRVARLPDGARLERGHVVLRRSDWYPRGDVAVELVDAQSVATPSARGWRSQVVGPDGVGFLAVDVSLPPPDEASGTDVAIVLDDSAATDSGALEIARAAVDAALHQLGPHDRASLLLGDLRAVPAEGTAGELRAVDDGRREAILDAIAHARPGGASNLGRMLADAYATLDPRRNGVVLYLGDATPTVGTIDPSRLVDEVQRSSPDLRLYALALGGDSHPEVLSPLTRMGGAIERVTDGAHGVTAVSDMIAHALRPCLRDVTVDLGPKVSHPLPSRVGVWVAGDPLRIVGELSERPPARVHVTARVGAETRQWDLALATQTVTDLGDLSRRWAQARITRLWEMGGGRASIAELGARYGVITTVSALAMGATEPIGMTVQSSPWVLDDAAPALPVLGVSESLTPRGVRSVGTRREVDLAVDDADGWSPHRTDESVMGPRVSALTAALQAAATPLATACVERKRAVRPGLAGTAQITATVDDAGRVTLSRTDYSSFNDAEVDDCVRRAVTGVLLPSPVLLGENAGAHSAVFSFSMAGSTGPGAPVRGACAASASMPRDLRRVLWRERIAARGASADNALAVWDEARTRCELRGWEDRVAMLEVLLDVLTDPAEVSSLRNRLTDPVATEWLDRAMLRRYGPRTVWTAYLGRTPYVDWSSLLTRLADPRTTLDQRIALLRAWLTAVPRDIDLRLRLMSALEEANRGQEARQVAERLRRDPLADARVRTRVAELLLRLGARDDALRAFTEIAEFAPYDAAARARLGDLLLTYAQPEEAYHQYQTLVALRPDESLPRVRMALAALAGGRDDEGLRLLRRAVEQSGNDPSSEALQSVLDQEVARITTTRPDDTALRIWQRVVRAFPSTSTPELMARWTHPDAGIELLVKGPGDPGFARAGETPMALGLRRHVFETDPDETHLVLRLATGSFGRRTIDGVVQVRVPGDASPVRVSSPLHFDATHRALGFVVRHGQLVAEPVATTEQPPARIELE